MGQIIFFGVFVIVFLAGIFAYFAPAPSPKSLIPIKDVLDEGGFNSLESLNIKKIQELNITTSGGLTEIRNVVDDLAQEQEGLKDVIDSEQKVLTETGKEINEIASKADDKSDIDVLRLKSLSKQMKDDQRLLMVHGQSLIDLNDKLLKTRQKLSEEGDMINANNESLLRLQQQNNNLLNEQSSTIFDKVKQENNDTMQRTQDTIDEEREKAMDQQR